MKYEKPEIQDLGVIGDHTFFIPISGSHKGTGGHDPFGELSAKNDTNGS